MSLEANLIHIIFLQVVLPIPHRSHGAHGAWRPHGTVPEHGRSSDDRWLHVAVVLFPEVYLDWKQRNSISTERHVWNTFWDGWRKLKHSCYYDFLFMLDPFKESSWSTLVKCGLCDQSLLYHFSDAIMSFSPLDKSCISGLLSKSSNLLSCSCMSRALQMKMRPMFPLPYS